jgi:FeoC like transcriptional regulator
MAPAAGSPGAGLKASDLLALPAEQRRVLRLLMRRGPASLPEIAEALGESPEILLTVLEILHGKGYVALPTVDPPACYQVCWVGARANDAASSAGEEQE